MKFVLMDLKVLRHLEAYSSRRIRIKSHSFSCNKLKKKENLSVDGVGKYYHLLQNIFPIPKQ